MLTAPGPKIGNRLSANIKSLRSITKFKEYIRRWFGARMILIIFKDSLMFYQIFLSPQGKRCAIIPHKHGMNELLEELLNDLRLRILGN